MSTNKFLKTWRRTGSWGFVVLKAGQLPASAERDRMLKTVAAMETIGDHELLQTGFNSLLMRWPDDPTALLGLGNAHLALGRPAEAERTYRRLLRIKADHIAARNNLALALADQGCYRQALTETNRAIKLNKSNPIYHHELLDTRQDIEHRLHAQPDTNCETRSR
jgi:tetratricopeptide (TPR) repeat protein